MRPIKQQVIEMEASPSSSATYVHPPAQDDWEDDPPATRKREWLHECTQEQVAEALGVSRQRVDQLETIALSKLRAGLAIEERLGPRAAAPYLKRLRGQPLAAFRQTLEDIERGVCSTTQSAPLYEPEDALRAG